MARTPTIAATGLFLAGLLAALTLHAVPALLAGVLAFVLTRRLLARLKRFALPRWMLGHELLAALVVGLCSLAVLAGVAAGIARLLKGESLHDLILTLATTVEQAKHYLPASVADQVPGSVLEIKELLAGKLKEHANIVAGVSTHALHGLVLTLAGWIAGVLAAVRQVAPQPAGADAPAFIAAWHRLWRQFGTSFEQVAFAQSKIAALNATLTAVFLLGVAPLAGWDIPYAKTLVLVTFLCGLLPVVGNLISNTVMCTLALSVSLPAAAAALAFLVVIHKLEYFMAARIQGHEIGAQAWELLIMLFAFEIVFGPAGMVAAPIIYAFAKAELRRMCWLS